MNASPADVNAVETVNALKFAGDASAVEFGQALMQKTSSSKAAAAAELQEYQSRQAAKGLPRNAPKDAGRWKR